MITILYTPGFIRKYKKLPELLRQEVRDKIFLFQENPVHHFLKTHKLKARLKGFWSFSVNYEYRVIFQYDTPTTVALLTVGNHDIYL